MTSTSSSPTFGFSISSSWRTLGRSVFVTDDGSHGGRKNPSYRSGTEGKPLEGFWRSRSLEYEAERRGKEVDPEAFIERYTLELDPLPCWRHLPKEEIRRRIAEMVEEIDAEHARRVVLNGRAPLGVEAIRKQHPHSRPEHTKKSPAPAVHAASKAVRKQMKAAYRLFAEAYCEAAARLRAGDLTVDFPPGCFPPARPFVPADAGLPCSRAGPARAPG